MSGGAGRALLHSSAVAFPDNSGWAGILILGRSGAGKSELALELIALGARLIADDQTELTRQGDAIWLSAPQILRGMIELRGMGLLRAEPLDAAPLVLTVDLDTPETERLPLAHSFSHLGVTVPCLRRAPTRVFAIGLKHYVAARPWAGEGADA